MKKKIYGIILIIFLVICIFILSGILVRKNIKKIQSEKKQEEIVRDITFEPYSNVDKLKILVVAKDTENTLEKVQYFQNDKKIEINCNKKEEVAFDYEIENDGEYKFSFVDGKGDIFEKTLQINSDYKENLINIQSNSEKELGTEVNISIDYSKVMKANCTYKIGEKETNWTNYQNEFKITSYQVLEKNLQNSDNKTVNIYAKSEDKANNKVIISKNIVNLDLDMPQKPEIQVLEIDKYATISANGIAVSSREKIKYDERNDITNYYSLDNCRSWIKVNGSISGEIKGIRNWRIYAKSVKNVSGLECSSDMELNPTPSANNAIGVRAYDGNYNTSFTTSVASYMLVDDSVIGQTIKVNTIAAHREYLGHIRLIGSSGEVLYDVKTPTATYNIKILEGTKKLQYSPYNPWDKLDQLVEIVLLDQPKISVQHIYPKLHINKVVDQPYEIISIAYRANDLIRQYKINDGQYQEYNGNIIIKKGDTIYAKAINSAGFETLLSQYTYNYSGDIESPAYDGNESTAYTSTSPSYITIDESLIGKNLVLKTVAADSYTTNYMANLTLLGQNGENLYTKKASTAYHTIKILEGTKTFCYSPYNPWDHPDKLLEIYITD